MVFKFKYVYLIQVSLQYSQNILIGQDFYKGILVCLITYEKKNPQFIQKKTGKPFIPSDPITHLLTKCFSNNRNTFHIYINSKPILIHYHPNKFISYNEIYARILETNLEFQLYLLGFPLLVIFPLGFLLTFLSLSHQTNTIDY